MRLVGSTLRETGDPLGRMPYAVRPVSMHSVCSTYPLLGTCYIRLGMSRKWYLGVLGRAQA